MTDAIQRPPAEERYADELVHLAACVGDGGDGRFAVALRSALIDGAEATVWAGAGIVDGSDPDAEFAETEIKMKAMGAAFGEPREERPPARNIARRRTAASVPGGATETLIPVEAEG